MSELSINSSRAALWQELQQLRLDVIVLERNLTETTEAFDKARAETKTLREKLARAETKTLREKLASAHMRLNVVRAAVAQPEVR